MISFDKKVLIAVTSFLVLVGAFAYFGVYMPKIHAQTIGEMEELLKTKDEVIEKVIKDTHKLTNDLNREVENVIKEKEKIEEESKKIEEEAKLKEETLKKEKEKILEESKKKEETIIKEKEKLEQELKKLEKEKKELEQKVALKEARKQDQTQGRVYQASNLSTAEAIQFTATAYTADCRGCSGITATGVDIRHHTPKIIAVDPNVIPLGSTVEIIHNGKSMGQYKAADKGSSIKGYKIDILMDSKSKANSFGNQKVLVKRIN